MWNWFKCYLSGRHDYGAWCESGAMFLRCVHCGRRSAGWSIGAKAVPLAPPRARVTPPDAPPAARVVPFPRAATR